MTFILRRRWPNLRQVPAGTPIDNYWIQRGLKSFYILDTQRWRINQVTGQIGGNIAGTGVSFPNGWLRTPGTTSNGATLQHGLKVDITYPITVVCGYTSISWTSSSVAWSLLDSDTSTWNGIFGRITGEIVVCLSSTFDGSVLTSGQSVAACVRGAKDLRGAGANNGVLLNFSTDTAFAVPTAVSPTTVALGWSRRNATNNDNPTVAEFTHMGFFQGALLDEELRMLAMNPQTIFKPQRTYVRNSYYPILSNLQAVRGNTSANLSTNVNY